MSAVPTFADLVRAVDWPATRAALLSNYADAEASLAGYEEVLGMLRDLEPAPTDMRIVLLEVPAEDPGQRPGIEVVGRNGRLNRELPDFEHYAEPADSEFAMAETTFSLVMERWENWLGMRIDPATLAAYPAPELVAHCLWEMTFHGFDQEEVQDYSAELHRRVEEVAALTDEEREQQLVPLERLLQRRPGDEH